MKKLIFLTLFLFVSMYSFCQAPPGISEIGQAKSQMAQNVNALASFSLVLGAVFGIVGGLRVYTNWNLGKKEVDIQVISWVGACVFLMIVSVFVKAFFNI